MVLDWLKQLFGSEEVTGYEREVLEREHMKVSGRIRELEAELANTPTAKSKKKQNPRAKRLISELDKLRQRRREIEKKLGGPPASAKRRRSRRS